MNSWPAAVIFDFDGVIVNSEPLHMRAFQEVLRAEKIDLTEAEYYRDLIGFDDRGAFKHLYESRGLRLDSGNLLRLLTHKGETTMELINRRHYEALPGAAELIRGLWRNYPLAICSGARRDEIEAMLEGVSLRDCFPDIVAAEDVSVGKPDPEGYLLATQQISSRIKKPLKPADVLVIEDAPSVVRSARMAGFTLLAVATSHAVEDLSEANHVVTSLKPAEVLKKIPQLKVTI